MIAELKFDGLEFGKIRLFTQGGFDHIAYKGYTEYYVWLNNSLQLQTRNRKEATDLYKKLVCEAIKRYAKTDKIKFEKLKQQ